MVSLVRGSRRLMVISPLESGSSSSKYLNGRKNVRAYSRSVAKCKIVEGVKGERIFTSPYPDIVLPSLTIPEFIWKNVPEFSNNIALECGITGRKYTYSRARDAANHVARSLRSLGMRPGDTVALVSPNHPEYVIAFLGILEAGAIATTVNPFYTVEEITKQLIDSGAKAVITAADNARVVIAAAERCMPAHAPRIVIEDGTCDIPEGTIPFVDLMTRGRDLPPLPNEERSADELAVLPYSSGTTGLPKGVELTHKHLVSDMLMVNGSMPDHIFENSEKDVIPAFLPFFHIYGMNGMMLPRLAVGSKLVTLPKFTPENFVNILENHKCTQLFCVPPIVLFLGAAASVKKHHFAAMRSIFSGAAPLAESDVQKVYEKFSIGPGELTFLQGYGMTECSAVAFTESSNSKFASIGHPLCNSEVRLVDPTTYRDVTAAGQTGELWIRGPHVMRGYRGNEEATKNTIHEGWLKTGDVAYYDDDYDFFITDRLKELVKVKGFQVPPAELEAILRTHPDVEDAAVIGIPDARAGELPKAFVLKKQGAAITESELQQFVNRQVTEYKELKGGVVFVDSIPRNPSGKILRLKLRQM